LSLSLFSQTFFLRFDDTVHPKTPSQRVVEGRHYCNWDSGRKNDDDYDDDFLEVGRVSLLNTSFFPEEMSMKKKGTSLVFSIVSQFSLSSNLFYRPTVQ
jgi:hypothetical protein